MVKDHISFLGRGGLVDRAADSGPYDPSSIPLGEKREKEMKKRPGLAHIKKKITSRQS